MDEFIHVAKVHQEEMSRLCDLCSLLTHSVIALCPSGSTMSVLPTTDSFAQLSRIVPTSQLRQHVMGYKVTKESMYELYDRMKIIAKNDFINNVCEEDNNSLEENFSTDTVASLINYHVGLCDRAMKSCFYATVEQEAHAVDRHTHECRTVALAAVQSSISRLQKYQR
jgi:hypothetical protein